MIPTIEYNGELFIPRIKVNKRKKWIKHVHCNGARFHVLSYYGKFEMDGHVHAGICCSESDCIYNKPIDLIGEKK